MRTIDFEESTLSAANDEELLGQLRELNEKRELGLDEDEMHRLVEEEAYDAGDS